MKRLIGFQIVERETDDPPDGYSTFEVIPQASLETHLNDFFAAGNDSRDWRLIPIFEGDVEELEMLD